jgi:hypothetical protein
VRAIDKEIRSSNSLLLERRLPPFAAQRVAGADSPRSLARLITTTGWRPVDTEVRVTDPLHLAQTLGGSNLYGDDFTAPLRELIQNSLDAVRARRKFDGRPHDWGLVCLTFEQDELGRYLLHVDDNGIGMSERVLTSSLLDFGKSFWSSTLLQEEFPGLSSAGIDPIGQFGIGFFSVFMLGDDVKVFTKKSSGLDAPRALVFSGLSKRPIIRDSVKNELPLDVSTRVSVKLRNDEEVLEELGFSNDEDQQASLKEQLRILLGGVDVEVKVTHVSAGWSLHHLARWELVPAKKFLESIFEDDSFDGVTARVIEAHIDLIRPIFSESGEVIGRAALNVTQNMFSHTGGSYTRIGVGGLVYPRSDDRLAEFYVGLMPGITRIASRFSSVLQIPTVPLQNWLKEQLELIKPKKIDPTSLIKLAHSLVESDLDAGELPFCLKGRKLISYKEFWLT